MDSGEFEKDLCGEFYFEKKVGQNTGGAKSVSLISSQHWDFIVLNEKVYVKSKRKKWAKWY